MKRVIEISTRGLRLALKNRRVQVQQEQEILASIPVEDLGMIILGTTGVTVSSGVLGALGESGGAILACNDSQHPCGIFLPVSANSLHSERCRLQARMSIPLQKKLWSSLVIAKIRNQAANMVDESSRHKLELLAKAVRSGDGGNQESKAAQVYWRHLFIGSLDRQAAGTFRRTRNGSPPNNLLNYGYAIIRAASARALCAAGLNPAIGIHHQNRYSGFCLADDLMEPYRPFVDRVVVELVSEGVQSMGKDVKARLVSVIEKPVMLDSDSYPLGVAIERSASSLAGAIEQQVKGGAAAPLAARHLLVPSMVKAWR